MIFLGPALKSLLAEGLPYFGVDHTVRSTANAIRARLAMRRLRTVLALIAMTTESKERIKAMR